MVWARRHAGLRQAGEPLRGIGRLRLRGRVGHSGPPQASLVLDITRIEAAPRLGETAADLDDWTILDLGWPGHRVAKPQDVAQE